jgi:hypothetical protein
MAFAKILPQLLCEGYARDHVRSTRSHRHVRLPAITDRSGFYVLPVIAYDESWHLGTARIGAVVSLEQ